MPTAVLVVLSYLPNWALSPLPRAFHTRLSRLALRLTPCFEISLACVLYLPVLPYIESRTMSANNLPPGSTLSKLPSYEELQAERDLKQSFASLSRDHEDIQQLFKSVASKLETTPKIGEDNELCKEWDQLAKVRSPLLIRAYTV